MTNHKNLDPTTKLNDLKSMSEEEMAHARMQASNAADAIIQRYGRSKPEFLKLIASMLREKADKLIADRRGAA